MSYCRVHDGLHYEYDDGCPKCRDDAEQAASDRSEIISGLARSREDLAAAAVYIADAKNNPGDYDCPSCMFRTLKKGASRCPKCHADPGRQYWVDVETKERDARLLAKAVEEEWERGRPTRELEARAKVALAKNKGRWTSFWKFYYSYLIPILMFGSLSLFSIGTEFLNGFTILVPVLNWATIYNNITLGNNGTMTSLGLIFWVILGVILLFVTKPRVKMEQRD